MMSAWASLAPSRRAPSLGLCWAHGSSSHTLARGFPGQTRCPRRLPRAALALNLWTCRADGKVIREQQGALEGGKCQPPQHLHQQGAGRRSVGQALLGLLPSPSPLDPGQPPPLSTVCRGGKRSGLFKNSSCFLFIKVTHTRLQIVFSGNT